MRISSTLYQISWFLILLGFPSVSSPGDLNHVPTRIRDDVIVFLSSERGIGNCVAIIGDDGILVVDSSLPTGARAILKAIRQVTDKPVRYLINTHWHDDHIWGNQEYAADSPGVVIISHSSTRVDILERAVPGLQENIEGLEAAVASRELMLEQGVDNEEELRARLDLFRAALADFKAIRPTPPSLTVEETIVLHLGNLDVHISHPGRGHTRGDLIVHVPARGVLITGDLLTHPIPAAAEAFLIDWVETMKVLGGLEFSTIVPGHGPVLEDREHLHLVAGLLKTVVEQVDAAVRRGESLDNTMNLVNIREFEDRLTRRDPATVRALRRFFLEPAIESAYAELSRR